MTADKVVMVEVVEKLIQAETSKALSKVLENMVYLDGLELSLASRTNFGNQVVRVMNESATEFFRNSPGIVNKVVSAIEKKKS